MDLAVQSSAKKRAGKPSARAVTAMKGDRGKCLDAGASDCISKPVNTDQLLSLIRVWLFR